MRTFLLPLITVSLAAGPTVPLKAPIARVRLHPGEAWVTRVGQVRLEAGTQVVALADLPPGLAVQDLQVQARGPEGLKLGDVSVATDARELQETAEWKKLLAEHEAQRDRRDILESQRDAVAQQLVFLKNLQAAYDKELSARLTLQAPNAASVVEFARSLDGRMAELMQQERKHKRALEKLAEEERRHKAEMDRRRSESRTAPSRVQVELTSKAPGAVTVEVSYRTTEARWIPQYEARLSEDRKSLDLALYAAVIQQSGESWDDVQVEISNARPGRSLDLAEFDGPTRVGWQPELPLARKTSNIMHLSPGVVGGDARGNQYMADKAEANNAVATEATATTIEEASGLAITFKLDGRKSIPQDGEPHRFKVTSQVLKPELRLVASPRLDPTVYQTATFAAPNGLPLFPGSAMVHFAGSQRLGEAKLKLPAPGQPFQLGFGPYKPMTVSLRRLDFKQEQVGAFTKERQWTVRERIDLASASGEALEVEVRDPLVVSQLDKVKVTALPDTTPGAVEKVAGVRTWTVKVEPKGTLSLTLATQVRAPQEGVVTGLEGLGIR